MQEGDGEVPTQPIGIETRLYGRWQTRAWAAPVATGGIVPKNERGNVHVPPFAPALPEVSLAAFLVYMHTHGGAVFVPCRCTVDGAWLAIAPNGQPDDKVTK